MDVLTDDLTATAQEKEKAENVTLNPPAEKQTVQPKAEKPKTQKPKAVKKKAVRTKKAVKAQKPKQPAKPAVKQPVKPAAKYEVKENGSGDAHDKLKPRANPVPVVKVLPVAPVPVPTGEASAPAEQAAAEPQLSKHFLEQRQKEERAAKELEMMKQALVEQQKAISAPKAEKTASAERTTAKTEAAKWSVVPVVTKMTPKERSAFLVKSVPADSATAKAVARNKDLTLIFVFSKNAVDLTDEMKTELDALAKTVNKTKNSRVLVMSYSGSTAPETGKERQVSLRRALMVRSALARAGVSSLRIEIRSQGLKGAGDKMPDRADILIDG